LFADLDTGEKIAEEGFDANVNLPALKKVRMTIDNVKRRVKKTTKLDSPLNIDNSLGNFSKYKIGLSCAFFPISYLTSN
jgi:hypothetical protein